MSLTGLPNILTGIQSRTSWQQRCQYLLIVEKWSDIVGESVAKQTCPIGLYQKSLQVAVSSPVWSQALTFERIRILAKVNALLGEVNSLAIADIHFSTAKWATQQKTIKESKVVPEDHPSYLPAIADPSPQSKVKTNPKNGKLEIEQRITKSEINQAPETASDAFQRWQSVMKQRTHQMPQCPSCDRPALTGEITRWQMCRVCAIENLFK
jgi:predicted nucleic acid-binding Zn ribbon protein